jgi:hypothetical protein
VNFNSTDEKDRERLIEQIAYNFRKLKEPPLTTLNFYKIGRSLTSQQHQEKKTVLSLHKLTGMNVVMKIWNRKLLAKSAAVRKASF